MKNGGIYLFALLLSTALTSCSGPSPELKRIADHKVKATEVIKAIMDSLIQNEGGKLDALTVYKFKSEGDSFLIGFNLIGADKLNREFRRDSVELWLNKYYRIIDNK